MRSIRNCNVAVVGGAGFLGSHLVNYLVEDRHCDVWVIDNLSAGRREFIHPDAAFFHHDVTGSEQQLFNILKGVQYVFNYAAIPYIPDSFARPLRVCDVNFFGALKVINAAQEAGCEGILQVSSAEIYGDHPNDSGGSNLSDMKICETDPVTPHSSYGASKAAVDALCQVRWREARTPVIALRQFNCMGERETHPYIVPEIIGQLSIQRHTAAPMTMKMHAKGEVRLGNNSTRDFLYAGDAVRIAVELLERGQFGEVYNLGSEQSIKMYDLAKLVGEVMGFADVQVVRDEARVRPWEIWHLQSDNGKLRRCLDELHGAEKFSFSKFELASLEEAIRRTVAWYESNGRKWAWER